MASSIIISVLVWNYSYNFFLKNYQKSSFHGKDTPQFFLDELSVIRYIIKVNIETYNVEVMGIEPMS